MFPDRRYVIPWDPWGSQLEPKLWPKLSRLSFWRGSRLNVFAYKLPITEKKGFFVTSRRVECKGPGVRIIVFSSKSHYMSCNRWIRDNISQCDLWPDQVIGLTIREFTCSNGKNTVRTRAHLSLLQNIMLSSPDCKRVLVQFQFLKCTRPCDFDLSHDRWGPWVRGQNYSLRRVVEAIYVQSLPHPH